MPVGRLARYEQTRPPSFTAHADHLGDGGEGCTSVAVGRPAACFHGGQQRLPRPTSACASLLAIRGPRHGPQSADGSSVLGEFELYMVFVLPEGFAPSSFQKYARGAGGAGPTGPPVEAFRALHRRPRPAAGRSSGRGVRGGVGPPWVMPGGPGLCNAPVDPQRAFQAPAAGAMPIPPEASSAAAASPPAGCGCRALTPGI